MIGSVICSTRASSSPMPASRGSAAAMRTLLLRQYFPKGTDLRIHSAATLQDVAQRLNNRPRKTLGWRTPADVFHAGVASHS